MSSGENASVGHAVTPFTTQQKPDTKTRMPAADEERQLVSEQ